LVDVSINLSIPSLNEESTLNAILAFKVILKLCMWVEDSLNGDPTLNAIFTFWVIPK